MLSSIYSNTQLRHNSYIIKQLEEKYMPCIFLLQEIGNVADLDLEKKKLKLDDLREFLDIEGTLAGTAFLLNVGKKELQIELVSVAHGLYKATRYNIEQKRWLLRKCLDFSNSDRVCNMAIVKLKESSGIYDFATFEVDFTFHNAFQSEEFEDNKRYGMTKNNSNFNKSELFFKPYCGDYDSALAIPFVMMGFEDFVLKVDRDILVKAQIRRNKMIEIQGSFKEGSSGKPLFYPIDGSVLGMVTHYHAYQGKTSNSYWVLDVSSKSLINLLEAAKGKKEPFSRNQISEYPSMYEGNLNSSQQTPKKETKLECVSVGETHQSDYCFDENYNDLSLNKLQVSDSPPDHTDWLKIVLSYMESGNAYTENQLHKLQIPGYGQKMNGDERHNYHKVSVRREALEQGVKNGILLHIQDKNKYRKDTCYKYAKLDYYTCKKVDQQNMVTTFSS